MPRGRPHKPGKRSKSGRRISSQPIDRGADHVQRRRGRFTAFHKGQADQQVFDAIGRAWCVGLLENDRFDPAVLRDVGREYGAGYWAYYEGGAAIARYEGALARTSSVQIPRDRKGELFQKMDALLRDAGRTAYDATQALCVDPYLFPDEDPFWLDRLINERLVKAKEPVCGRLPSPTDYVKMAHALAGLKALAEGTDRKRKSLPR